MTKSIETPPTDGHPNVIRGILARGWQILFLFIWLRLVLFLGSGDLTWTAAWIYLGISVLSVVINSFFMLRNSPENVAERGTAKGWQGWDKVISG